MKKIRIKLSLLIFLIFPQLLYASENKDDNELLNGWKEVIDISGFVLNKKHNLVMDITKKFPKIFKTKEYNSLEKIIHGYVTEIIEKFKSMTIEHLKEIQKNKNIIKELKMNIEYSNAKLIHKYANTFYQILDSLKFNINDSIRRIEETNNQTHKRVEEIKSKYELNLEKVKNEYMNKFQESQNKYNKNLKEIENKYNLNSLNLSKYNKGIEGFQNKYKNSLKKVLQESLKGQKDKTQSPKNNWVPGLILALPLATIIIVQYIQLKVNKKKADQLKPKADLKLTQKAKTK